MVGLESHVIVAGIAIDKEERGFAVEAESS